MSEAEWVWMAEHNAKVRRNDQIAQEYKDTLAQVRGRLSFEVLIWANDTMDEIHSQRNELIRQGHAHLPLR